MSTIASIFWAANASSMASSSATLPTIVSIVSDGRFLFDRLVLGDRLDDALDLVGREGLLDRLVLGDRLGDAFDPVGREGLLDRLVLGHGLDDLVDLGGGELLADLRERGGQRVVDPALGLLDRVGHRVAALGSRASLGARGAGSARDTAGRRPRRRDEPAAPPPA